MSRMRGACLLLIAGAMSVTVGCRERIDAATGEVPAGDPGLLQSVPTAPVTNWVGPDSLPFEVTVRSSGIAGAHARPFGMTTLGTSFRARDGDLRRYPCSSCHVGRRVVMTDDRIDDAHEDVRAQHPSLTGARCATCHSADDVERLALKSGEVATLDHVYRICAECHNAEATAWAAGAHGKRLDGWQGRRVVMGCADCHDPHAPAIGTRIPFKAPRIGARSD
jgi:hypothetical protein